MISIRPTILRPFRCYNLNYVRRTWWLLHEEIHRRKSELAWAARHCYSLGAIRYCLWIFRDALSNVIPLLNFAEPHRTVTLRLRTASSQSLSLYLSDVSLYTFWQVYVDEIYRLVLDHGWSPQTIVDVGANIGMTSRWMLQHFPQAMLIAVEPEPRNARLLRANLIGFPNAHVFEGSVTSQDGEVFLRLSLRADSHKIVAEQGECTMSVRSITIPTLMENYGLNYIDCLKIDIEGAEAELLAACANWIGKVKCMIIEIHTAFLTFERLEEIMKNHSFRILRSDKFARTRIVICFNELFFPSKT